MRYLKGVILVLLATVLSAANAELPARVEKNINMVDRVTGSTIAGVDIGRFQADEDNVVIVPDTAVKDTVVCRFRSAAGNCYRLSVNDGRGSVPVPLIDSGSFNNFLAAFRARPNWEACEIIENPWGEWQPAGAIPTAAGTHTYTEERFCSTGGLLDACPDTCATARETRTTTVTNVPACTDSYWTPQTFDYWDGQVFTQTSNCGNTRIAYGTYWEPVEEPIYYPPPEPEPPEPPVYIPEPVVTEPTEPPGCVVNCGGEPPVPVCTTEIVYDEYSYPGMWMPIENYYDDPGNGWVYVPGESWTVPREVVVCS